MATRRDRPARDDLSPGRRRTGRSCATFLEQRPALRRLRDLRPRGARVRADALGRRLGRATEPVAARSSSTTARRRSRCSSWAARTASRRSCATSSGRAPPTSRRDPTALPRGRGRTTAWTRARRWSGCGSTGPASARTRPRVQRLLPVEIGDLNRLYQLGFASWLPVDAPSPTASTTAIRVNGRSSPPPAPTSSARRRGWRSSATS